MPPKSASLLQGTLEMIVLQLLRAEPTNGYELAQRIETISRDVLTINAGSLYPALYRLEERDLIRATWEESKTGRKVKVYSLTAAGRKELADQREEWARFTGALAAILKVTG
jgi:PadR family transcriptional regulator PadR